MINNKKYFGLDLDETLISAKGSASGCKTLAFDNGFDFLIDDFLIENGEQINYYYLISERPYLMDFIKYLDENYNVFIFSRAEFSYVHKIVAKLGFDSKKTPVFTRDDCDIVINEDVLTYKKNLVKISKKLGVKTSDMFFLDDAVDVDQITQIGGLIHAPEYVVNEHDDFLRNLVLDMKNGAI